MRGQQIRIALIQGVLDPVIVERLRFGEQVVAHQVLAPRLLVDVIAVVDDQIGIVFQDVPIGGEVAVLVLLARHQRQIQFRGLRVGSAAPCACGRRCSARPQR